MSRYLMKKESKINVGSVTATLVILGLAYSIYAFAPAYWPFVQVRGVLKAGCQYAYRQADADEEKVLQFMLKHAARIKLNLGPDNFRFTREPYVGAPNQGSELLYRRGSGCLIEFAYQDEKPLPFIDKTFKRTWNTEEFQDYTEVKKVESPIEGCRCVSTTGARP